MGWSSSTTPSPPADLPHPDLTGRVPTVALFGQDWEFLFDQLRSSHAVIAYLTRVVGTSGTLGEEPERYYEPAAPSATDLHAPSHGVQVSATLLPTAPAGSDDPDGHAMLRMMCEDIANSPTNEVDEDRRLRVLVAIDELPILHRSSLGGLLLNGLEQFRSTAPDHQLVVPHDPLTAVRTPTRLRRLLETERPHTGRLPLQAAAPTPRTGLRPANPDELTTVGVLLTGRTDGHRE